ncbi:MAG: D-glycero-alpha-D-manno-heptose-1,7-bisphosphate 7-phosphatase [Planctomycetota bacterium]
MDRRRLRDGPDAAAAVLDHGGHPAAVRGPRRDPAQRPARPAAARRRAAAGVRPARGAARVAGRKAVRRTVFLDRDGTINREVDYCASPAQLELLPGAADAIRRLCAAGHRCVITTNQSGVARGYFTQRALARVHEALHELLGRLPLAYLHCPHHPDAAGGDDGYRRACSCRKPGAGLLHEACTLLGPLGVSLDGAVVVGDSARDLLMARELPVQKVLVRSGKPHQEQRRLLLAAGCRADHECADLAAAADWLLA